MNSNQVGISVEYTLTPLLTALSHILSDSKIQFSEKISESFICYSFLICNPSMGKSLAIKIVEDAVLNCEKTFYKNKKSLTNLFNDKF